MYISLYFKIHKNFKTWKIKNYLALPMLLLEGGQGLDHLENPSQHMETTPLLATTAPTKSRSHHRIHSALSHLYLPTCSA